MNPETITSRLLRAGVQLVVGLIPLLALRVVMSSLPMLREAPPIPGIPVSYVTVGRAALDTIILILIWRCGSEFGAAIKDHLPALPDSRTPVQLGTLILILVLAYGAYYELARALLQGSLWVYSIVFLILVVIPLFLLAWMSYRHSGALADLVTHRLNPTTSEALPCPNCHGPTPEGANFCPSCGSPVPTETAAEGTDDPVHCRQCGAAVDATDRFCTHCGVPLRQP